MTKYIPPPSKVLKSLSYNGEEHWKNVEVDLPVDALQEAGIDMYYSCCGHNRGDGEITLVDGRILTIKFPA